MLNDSSLNKRFIRRCVLVKAISSRDLYRSVLFGDQEMSRIFKMNKEKTKKSTDLKTCSRQLFKFVQVEMNVLQDCTSKAMKSRDHMQSNIFMRGFRKPRENRSRWYILFAAAVLIISLIVVAITLAIHFGTSSNGKGLSFQNYGLSILFSSFFNPENSYKILLLLVRYALHISRFEHMARFQFQLIDNLFKKVHHYLIIINILFHKTNFSLKILCTLNLRLDDKFNEGQVETFHLGKFCHY